MLVQRFLCCFKGHQLLIFPLERVFLLRLSKSFPPSGFTHSSACINAEDTVSYYLHTCQFCSSVSNFDLEDTGLVSIGDMLAINDPFVEECHRYMGEPVGERGSLDLSCN